MTLLFFTFLACGAPSYTPLVDAESWEAVGLEDDPWSDDFEGEPCDGDDALAIDTLASGPALEILTEACGWVTVRQPSMAAASAGDGLLVDIFHGDLNAEEPAEATIWLAVGESEYEWIVPIPSDAGTLRSELELEADVAEGEDIFFHVHNHGDNYYLLLEVSAETPT